MRPVVFVAANEGEQGDLAGATTTAPTVLGTDGMDLELAEPTARFVLIGATIRGPEFAGNDGEEISASDDH